MDTEFMWRLRSALEKKGITRTELSKISGVSKGDITHYLKGDYIPKQDKCYLLARALDVDPGWLMTGVEQVKEDYPLSFYLDAGGFAKVLAYMSNYCFEDYKVIVDILNRTCEKMKKEGIEL